MRRSRLAFLAAAAVSLISGSLVLAIQPAHAESYYRYRNSHYGLCITGDWGGAYGHDCLGLRSQLWKVHDGSYRLGNEDTGWCLDTNGTNGDVYTGVCNDGPNQKWNVYPDGRIVSHVNDWCLDMWDGGKLYARSCNSQDFQKWIQH
jgi:hypothetical protein